MLKTSSFVVVVARLVVVLVAAVRGAKAVPSEREREREPWAGAGARKLGMMMMMTTKGTPPITVRRLPTARPVPKPTKRPTKRPTRFPTTARPTRNPTTARPTLFPTEIPTYVPTKLPTLPPTRIPTPKPTYGTGESVACTGVGTATSYQGHLYKAVVVASPATWDEAGAEAATVTCCGAAGHLAAITSPGENDFIQLSVMGGAGSAWIGVSDKAAEGAYAWSTGEAITYTNWNSGEPNDGDDDHEDDHLDQYEEDCGEMFGVNGKWNDNTCTFRQSIYIIEFDCT